ncbi:WYL domain-containing protein [Paenibacillus donghaensis]|uniref:helix-turn-helix transcriptional regulator n=1 Tax=Paenibacillus donghaensis TaxID=414771 RepID=UPI00188365A3|nr:WYL domain-containing protein [Paenibacillus donghaensis]MBE9914455.1 WYL domain-containing protein [Paenibacillus donghaensis]
MTKLDYILSVLWLLRTKGKMTAEQIAGELEVSVRTVYRYIDVLGLSGVPVISEAGHGGGFSLPDSFLAMPLFFDLSELKAMAHGVELARQAGDPYADALERALGKIKQRLNDYQQEDLRRHAAGFAAEHAEPSPELQKMLRTLEQTVAGNRTLIMLYAKHSGDSGEERRIDPYGLFYRPNRWYLAAYCHARQSIRIFRADRIKAAVETGQRFAKPESFSIRQYIEEDAMRAGPEEREAAVRLRGESDVLDSVASLWFLKACRIERKNEFLNIAMPEAVMLEWLPHVLLSYGKQVQVVEPFRLKQAMAELAADLSRFYGSS